jgi:hypothetical protein
MSNQKLRISRMNPNEKGPSNGPSQPILGAETIRNTPYESTGTPTRSSGPVHQPNSSLGAKRVPHPVYGKKA